MDSQAGTVLLTGANGGLGRAIVAEMLAAPEYASCHTVCAVRRVDGATELQGLLQKAGPGRGNYEIAALDLSRLGSVRQAAADINARVAAGSLPRIRCLILNAAYQEHTTQDFTPDGFDMTFQCNYLSHWLLVLLLLQSMDRERGRVVVVGSWSHNPLDPRNDSMGAYVPIAQWATLFHDADSLARGTWSSSKEYPTMHGGFRRYGAGKLCEIMMIHELQERLDADPALAGLAVLGVDPGGMVSGLTRRGSPWLVLLVQWVFPLLVGLSTWLAPNGTLRSVAKSARDVLRAAFDTATLGTTPKALYLNGSEPGDTSSESKDPRKRRELWQASVRYTALRPEETILGRWE